MRDEKQITAAVTLSKNDVVPSKLRGMELENLSSADKQKLQISSGVKIKSVEKADSMTQNQLTAWVRDYYSANK